MIEDLPIPFDCSVLMLSIDFQAIENKDGAVDLGQSVIAQLESSIHTRGIRLSVKSLSN